MTAKEITRKIVHRFFPPRTWAVCPNVAWGRGINLPGEADIYAVSDSNRTHEVEVKVSASDLRRDRLKDRWQRQQGWESYVDCYWLVVPVKLEKLARRRAEELKCGLFLVHDDGDIRRVITPKVKRRKFKEIHELKDRRPAVWRLCSLRYWEHALSEKTEGG